MLRVQYAFRTVFYFRLLTHQSSTLLPTLVLKCPLIATIQLEFRCCVVVHARSGKQFGFSPNRFIPLFIKCDCLAHCGDLFCLIDDLSGFLPWNELLKNLSMVREFANAANHRWNVEQSRCELRPHAWPVPSGPRVPAGQYRFEHLGKLPTAHERSYARKGAPHRP